MSKLSRLVPLIASPLLLAGLGCDRQAGPLEPFDSGPSAQRSAQPAGLWTIDDEWARIAREDIPGFAGYFLDDAGNTVVSLVDVGRRDAAERLVDEVRNRSQLRFGPVTIRPARYDFAQLKEWHDALVPILGLEGVYSTDIDETTNRINVGVASSTHIAPVAQAITGVGVPRDAFSVRIEEKPEFRQTLTSTFRPTLAGIQIRNDYRGYCTLGFNALYNDTRVFVTASHCSQYADLLDYSAFRQPQFGGYIGYEIADRQLQSGFHWFTAQGQGYNCSTPCRFSDANIVVYYGDVGSRTGDIARTTWAGVNGPGSLTIDSSRPSWDIFNKLTMPFMNVGRWLDKQGATSGWTHGQVTETCANRNYSGRLLLCQYRTSIWSEPGDSGSPIFLHNDQQEIHYPITTVHLSGILVGGPANNYNITDFSTIEAIEHDFSTTFKACNALNSC